MNSIAAVAFAEDDFQAETVALGASQPEVPLWQRSPEHFVERTPPLRIVGGDQRSGFCED